MKDAGMNTYAFENVGCLVCGNGHIEKLNETGQHGLPANVVICKNCGLSFLSPRWTKESYGKFYQLEYDKYYRSYMGTPSAGQDVAVQKSPVPAFERLKKKDLLPAGINHLLDIGSGNGGFLRQAKAWYPQASCYAIEPSLNCIPVLERNNIRHISPDVDSDWQTQYQSYFDFVYMRHVLEHFMDPLAVLKKVHETLTDNGLVYIAVPNSLKPGLPLTHFFFRAVHTYYFNKHTLTSLMASAGLVPVLIIEGDSYNNVELVIVARKGKAEFARVNAYKEQKELFAKYIDHERSIGYRLRKLLRGLIGKKQADLD